MFFFFRKRRNKCFIPKTEIQHTVWLYLKCQPHSLSIFNKTGKEQTEKQFKHAVRHSYTQTIHCLCLVHVGKNITQDYKPLDDSEKKYCCCFNNEALNI